MCIRDSSREARCAVHVDPARASGPHQAHPPACTCLTDQGHARQDEHAAPACCARPDRGVRGL
eukprot:7372606-Prymnesium_polylepis.1